MAISLNIAGSVKVLNPFPLDYWRGPWISVAAAKAGIPLGARFDGLTVKIIGDGEYWWLDGDLTDTGLIKKITTLSNGNGTTASGSAVDLGGTTTGDILISGDYDIELTEYTDGGADYSTIKLYDGNIDLVYFNSNVTGTETYESLLRFGTSILNRWSRNGGAGVSTVIGDDLNSSGGYGFSVYSVSSGYTPVEADLKFRIGTGGNVTLNLGSDATGDTYYRNSSGYFTRLAAVSAGSFLRSGGIATVNAWSTVKLPDTMSALGLWVANSANTTVNLTAAAGQSIRVNAGGTAWEAYTPSGGGIGGSTGTTDNSILRADGTGGSTLQNSSVSIDDSANLSLGTSGLAGSSRSLSVIGSAGNISLDLVPKGTSPVQIGSRYFQIGRSSDGDTFRTMTVDGSEANIVFDIYSKGATSWIDINGHFQVYDISSTQRARIQNNTYAGLRFDEGNSFFSISSYPTAATTADFKLIVLGDGATPTGNLYLNAPTTGGGAGNIALSTSSVSDFQDMQQGVVISNRTAAPTAGITNSVAFFAEDSNSSSEFYVMSESGAKVNISGLFEPVTESGTSFTLNETHRNKIVLCSNSGVVTVTVGTGKAAGWNCMLVATHATGTITLSTSGTTINGTTSTTTQFETLSLVHYGSENYLSKLG